MRTERTSSIEGAVFSTVQRAHNTRSLLKYQVRRRMFGLRAFKMNMIAPFGFVRCRAGAFQGGSRSHHGMDSARREKRRLKASWERPTRNRCQVANNPEVRWLMPGS